MARNKKAVKNKTVKKKATATKKQARKRRRIKRVRLIEGDKLLACKKYSASIPYSRVEALYFLHARSLSPSIKRTRLILLRLRACFFVALAFCLAALSSTAFLFLANMPIIFSRDLTLAPLFCLSLYYIL